MELELLVLLIGPTEEAAALVEAHEVVQMARRLATVVHEPLLVGNVR